MSVIFSQPIQILRVIKSNIIFCFLFLRIKFLQLRCADILENVPQYVDTLKENEGHNYHTFCNLN